MSSEDLQNCIEALRVIHDPTSTPQIRQRAQEFCVAIEENFSLCFSLGNLLFSTSDHTYAKHFGLHLLSQAIKKYWNCFTTQQKEEFKKTSLQLVTKIKPTEPIFIKEKLSTVWLELAKREWPQAWPNLIPQILEISYSGAIGTECALLFLRSLAEVGKNGTAEEIPKQRRLDLMTGLHNSLDKTFPLFFRTISLSMNSQSKENQVLLYTVLQTLAAFLGWVPHNYLFAQNFGIEICNLLVHPETRMIACDCLLEMFTRKGKAHERVQMLFIFEKIDLFMRALSVHSDDEEDYVFHKTIAQVLSLVGSLLIELRESIAKIPPQYSAYLDLMLQLLQYPSILLRSYVLPFWSSLLTTEVSGILPTDEILKKLLVTFAQGLEPLEMDENTDDPLHNHLEEDFSESEFLQFDTRFRGLIGIGISNLAAIRPLIALGLLAEAMGHFGSSTTPQIMLLMKHVFNGITEENFQLQNVCDATQFILQNVFTLENNNDAKLIHYQAEAFHYCTLFFHKQPETMIFVVRKFLEFLSKLDGTNSHVVSHKRHVHQYLVKFGQEHGESLLIHFDSLLQFVKQLSSMPVTSRSDNIFMMEFLTAVTNAKKDYQQQSGFIHNIVANSITILRCNDVRNVCETPQKFLTFVASQQNPNLLQEIFTAINTIHKVATKSKIPTIEAELQIGNFYYPNSERKRYPIETALREILPDTFTLCLNIGSLYDPSKKAQFPQHLQGALGLELHMVNEIENKYHINIDMKIEENARKLQIMLTELLTFCYRLIRFAMEMLPDFYSLIQIDTVYSSLFRALPSFDAFQVRSFSRHIASHYFLYRKKEEFGQSDGLLVKYLNYMVERVVLEWKTLENNTNEKAHDILNDKLVRILVGEFAQVLRHLILPKDASSMSDNPITDLGAYIIDTPSVLEVYLKALATVMSTSDPDSQSIIINCINSLLPRLLEKPEYHEMVSGYLFGIILVSLADVKAGVVVNLYFRAIAMIIGNLGDNPNVFQRLHVICGVPQDHYKGLTFKFQSATDKHRRRLIERCLRSYTSKNTLESVRVKRSGIRNQYEKAFRNKILEAEPPEEADLNFEGLFQ